MKKKTLIIVVVVLAVEIAVTAGYGIAYFNEKQQQVLENAEFEEINHDLLELESSLDMIRTYVGNDDYEKGFIVLTPSQKTYIIIDNLNAYIEESGVDLSDYGLKYPISIYDVDYCPSKINNFINNGINDIETAKGKSPEEIDALISNMFGEK